MGKIIWLASYPKSGNTWLRFFLYAYFKLDPARDQRIDINDQGIRYFCTQDVNYDWYQAALGDRLPKASAQEVAAHRRAAHHMIADNAPGVVMVKTHAAFLPDKGVPNITPEVTAGAIYVVRNPLDVACSLKGHFGHKSLGGAVKQLNAKDWRAASTAERVTSLIGSWSQNVESWAGDRRNGIFPVRYEDMIADPEKIFGWIIGVLGHEVDKERLRWAIDLTSFDRMQAAETEHGFREQSRHNDSFFRRGVAGGWRDELSTGQVRDIVQANHAMMRRFGYMDEKLERFAAKPSPAKKRLRRA